MRQDFDNYTNQDYTYESPVAEVCYRVYVPLPENEYVLQKYIEIMRGRFSDEIAEFIKIEDDCAAVVRSKKFATPDPCKSCLNHPDNGGSGICNCILGIKDFTC